MWPNSSSCSSYLTVYLKVSELVKAIEPKRMNRGRFWAMQSNFYSTGKLEPTLKSTTTSLKVVCTQISKHRIVSTYWLLKQFFLYNLYQPSIRLLNKNISYIWTIDNPLQVISALIIQMLKYGYNFTQM